jgi:hypothetical protein
MFQLCYTGPWTDQIIEITPMPPPTPHAWTHEAKTEDDDQKSLIEGTL